MNEIGFAQYLEVVLERFLRTYSSVGALKLTRLALVYPRFMLQLAISRTSFRRYRHRDAESLILIFGLPKSGTTWLENMLAEYPGYHSVYLPSMVHHEYKYGETLTYVLTESDLGKVDRSLTVLKTHAHASEITINSLSGSGARYIVLFRDLRDVAVSFIHFVKQRPWHPEHSQYVPLSLEKALEHFGHDRLPRYADWIRTWRRSRDTSTSMEVRYEELFEAPAATLASVANHFGLDSSVHMIEEIVSKYDFRGTEARVGRSAEATHFRRGGVGNWRQSFTADLEREYEQVWGDLREELGYPP